MKLGSIQEWKMFSLLITFKQKQKWNQNYFQLLCFVSIYIQKIVKNKIYKNKIVFEQKDR